MFGYIVINEPELRVREVALYRSYYCGLCEDLHESYGRFGQLALSYDTTFLGLLLTSLYEPSDERCSESSCLAHPFRRHSSRRSEYTRYAADVTILLAFHSARDHWEDEKQLRGLAFSEVLRGAYERAKEKHPQKAKAVEDCLARLHGIESGNECSADAAGACFGDLMAELFALRSDLWEGPLRRMGFYLGKYIYLLDAYDDLEKDEQSGSFNALLPVRARMREAGEDFDGYVRALLTMLMASCCRAFEALPIVENIDILRNILYAGVWTRFEEIFAARTAKDAAPDREVSAADDGTVPGAEDAAPQAADHDAADAVPGEASHIGADAVPDEAAPRQNTVSSGTADPAAGPAADPAAGLAADSGISDSTEDSTEEIAGINGLNEKDD